ncbi:MAG: ROK family protein [Micrococcales bacterium]
MRSGNQPSMALVGQSREATRAHNLSIVLKMVQHAGAITRSQLTTNSGLNRSTILNIVSELQELGLVTETVAPSAVGVGRPSLVVSANENLVAFAVNPESDATTVGLVSLSGKVLHRIRVLTGGDHSAAEAVETATAQISKIMSQLDPTTRIVGIGVAIPGQVRVHDGIVRFAPALNWVEVPIAAMLAQTTGLPVSVDNDASLGCSAEFTYGAGRGFSNVVSVFSGAGGIGGGVIIDGVQLRGATGYAGEIGHVRISSSSAPDNSGLQGTLEAHVRRDDLLHIFKLDSATDEELDLEIQRTKAAGAIRVLEAQVDFVGQAVANAVNLFNPEIVILEGFLASLLVRFETRLLDVVRKSALNAATENLLIRRGDLGSNAIMLGAADLQFGRLIENPAGLNLFAPAHESGAKPTLIS